MFLYDILDQAYLTEKAPTSDEILLMPMGFKTGIDHNMVVPRSAFESVMVQYRASEPASEAILMAIGKAKDISDPVWATLLTNECVVTRYNDLSNAFYAQQLEKLEGQNPPVSPAAAVSRLSSMTHTAGGFVDSAALLGKDTQFVPPPAEEMEEQAEEQTPGVGGAEEQTPGVGEEPISTEAPEAPAEEPQILPEEPAPTEELTPPVDEPDVSSFVSPVGEEEEDEGTKSMFGLPPSDMPDFGQPTQPAMAPDFGVPEDADKGIPGFDAPEQPVFQPTQEEEHEEEAEGGSSLAALMKEVAEEAPAVPPPVDEGEAAFVPPEPSAEEETGFVPPEPPAEEAESGFVPPQEEPAMPAPVEDFVPPVPEEKEEDTGFVPPQEEPQFGADTPITEEPVPPPPAEQEQAPAPVDPEEEERLATIKLKAMSGATDVFVDAERNFNQYGANRICAVCGTTVSSFIYSLEERIPEVRTLWEATLTENTQQEDQLVLDILAFVKTTAYELIEKEEYERVQEILLPIMQLIYEE